MIVESVKSILNLSECGKPHAHLHLILNFRISIYMSSFWYLISRIYWLGLRATYVLSDQRAKLLPEADRRETTVSQEGLVKIDQYFILKLFAYVFHLPAIWIS